MKQKTTISIEPEMKRKIDEIMRKDGAKFSTLIQSLLRDYIRKKEGGNKTLN